MKKLLSTILLFVLCATSQAKGDTIRVNFKESKKPFSKSSICRGHGVIIKVDSINTALHKVSIKFEDYELVSETPKMLEGFIPGILSNKIAAEFFENPTTEDIIRLNRVANLDEVIELIAEAKKKLSKQGPALSMIVMKAYTELIIDSLYKDLSTSERKKIDAKTCFAEIKYLLYYYITFYEVLEKQNSNIDGYSQELAHQIAGISFTYQKLKKSSTSLMAALDAIIAGTKEEAKAFFSSKMYYPKKDLTTVKIYIIDKFNPADTLRMMSEDIFIVNKWKLDFSTGLAYNNLGDNSYFFTRNDSAITGVDMEKKSFDFGVNALLHINYKICSSFSLGVSTGLSVSVFDAKTRYLLGLSATFGRYKSISLSGGWSFGKYTILSKQISGDGITVDKPERLNDFSEVPTHSILKSGYFVSLSYNLNRKKQK